MNADTNPAAGGLSAEERGGLLIALDCAVEGGTLTHDAAMRVLGIVDNHPAAEREMARVTAAVEALADELWAEGDRQTRRRNYPQGVAHRYAASRLRRAALSSADTTALGDLLDRERAKAWDEGVDWAWTPGHGDLRSDNPYRAAAVSPEGGGV